MVIRLVSIIMRFAKLGPGKSVPKDMRRNAFQIYPSVKVQARNPYLPAPIERTRSRRN